MMGNNTELITDIPRVNNNEMNNIKNSNPSLTPSKSDDEGIMCVIIDDITNNQKKYLALLSVNNITCKSTLENRLLMHNPTRSENLVTSSRSL